MCEIAIYHFIYQFEAAIDKGLLWSRAFIVFLILLVKGYVGVIVGSREGIRFTLISSESITRLAEVQWLSELHHN
jgi:hypothetical protein